MLRLLAVFEIDTESFAEDIGAEVTEKLIQEGFDVLHDDGGCDIYVNPRLGTNAVVEMFSKKVDAQTRCYITMCGDLYGISRKEAELQMQDNLVLLTRLFKVIHYTWSIVSA